MSKQEQINKVLVEFASMGATVFELVIECNKLMNDEEYLDQWMKTCSEGK